MQYLPKMGLGVWIGLFLAIGAARGEVHVATLLAETVLDGNTMGLEPGDTVILPEGDYRRLTIRNVRGSADAPIQFINRGLVTLDNRGHRGGALNIVSCVHVRVTGSGELSEPRAFDVEPPDWLRGLGIRVAAGEDGPHAINVIRQSSSIELDHIEVFAAGFAGFNVKDEASTITRDDFTMFNISLHHNFVHHVIGEGFYIGHTFYRGIEDSQTGETLFPHVIRGLRVHNNLTYLTGCEGIQIGSTIEDCEVRNNTILQAGQQPFARWQDNGIQIGEGTQARVVDNVIVECPGNAMVLFGLGENIIQQNRFIRPGGSGVYCRSAPQSHYIFRQNTFLLPGQHAIHIGNFVQPPQPVALLQNTIVMPDTPDSPQAIYNQNRNAPLDEQGNRIISEDESPTRAAEATWQGHPIAGPTLAPPSPWQNQDPN